MQRTNTNIDPELGDGTVMKQVGGIALCCMNPESRILLNTVMEEWQKHWELLPRKHRVKKADDVYGFAYWLIRWSGLVTGVKKERR